MPKEKNRNQYTAEQITVLEGLAPVRKRPGMYIGNTSTEGLHHMIWEVVDNAIDEAMAGYCSQITVELLPQNQVKVTDNGRGIPVDIHKQTKKSALETVMTTLHAGGKFEGKGYKVSGGLHGVGVSVVNALSEYMRAEVKRDGKIWVQEYSRGKAKGKIKAIGKTKETGTTIIFQPDPEIFDTLEFNWKKILNRLRQQAYLTKGVKIIAIDTRDKEKPPLKYGFYFEGGIASYVKHLNQNKNVKHETIFYVEKSQDNIVVEIALQYNDEFQEEVFSFANNIHTPEGGMHLVGFKTALTRTLNSYARKKNLLKEKDPNLTGDDVREGLTAVVSVKVPEPQFEGQTKAKLGNAEVRTVVDSIFSKYFEIFLEEHPKEAESIIGKCIVASRARIAARAARDSVLRKGALDGLTLPGKLADCSSRKAEDSELFIVEGDSAGGCFAGETKIALADGRYLNFYELIKEEKEGKQNYCYTIQKDGKIGIEKIKNVRRTKKSVEVIKVVLDNDEEIICTPDHLFLLRNGKYKQAKDLTPQDSLMGIREAVINFNHKIKRIEKVSQKMDVFDLEVPGTHNFALAAGVFVHNSAKQGRDREHQAILPLRGKILNVERARLDKILANNELKSLVVALGTNIGEQIDISKLRYHKIIIMTDADVDGAHIRTLLLTFFYRYLRPIITEGHLYIAQPPLYKIQKGKQVYYAYSDEEKEKIIAQINQNKKEGEEGGINIQRYKGLGEMNPEQLWETTMDPARRVIKKVTIENAEEANEIFDSLMGQDVSARKYFIQSQAQYVKNLDV